MQWTLLPTDLLFYFLTCSLVFMLVRSYRDARWRASWQSVLHHRTAMIAIVILFTYFSIALLDSIHFKVQQTQENYIINETPSLLDKLFTAGTFTDEQSYSAPFATHLYAADIVRLPNGQYQRQYQNLNIDTKQLKNPLLRKKQLYLRIFQGFVVATVSWLILCLIFNLMLARYHALSFFKQGLLLCQGKSRIAWRSLLLTVWTVMLFISISYLLSMQYHLFGTDQVGHDIFYAAIKSIRTGLIIGTVTTLLMLPFALIFGVVAGYFGSWIDDVIQYIYTTLSSIPGVLLISAAVLSLQIFMENHPQAFATITLRADIRLLALCIILGITSWTTLCRLLRAETLKLREIDYITAAVTMGAKPYQIILKHLLPNVMHIVLITVVLDFSGLVLAEAVLSYVGVGVDPVTFSWGNMINGARLELAREPVVWWPLCAAFIFMFILVLSANLLADIVRDAFDPRIHEVEEQ